MIPTLRATLLALSLSAPLAAAPRLDLGPPGPNLLRDGASLLFLGEARLAIEGKGARRLATLALEVLGERGELLLVTNVQGLAFGGPGWVLGEAPPTGIDVPSGRELLLYLPELELTAASRPALLRVTAVLKGGEGLETAQAELSLSALPLAPGARFPASGTWLALNAPSGRSAHRRAVTLLPGERAFANGQRYALDLVRYDQEEHARTGRLVLHRGDPSVPTSYLAYGEPVRSVADGKVVRVVDGLPDMPIGPPSNAENPAGNHVVVHHGRRGFGYYAHLAPGSPTVTEGEVVAEGTILGKVGNSGNTSSPHLHFHMADGPELYGSRARGIGFRDLSIAGRGRSVLPVHPRDGEIVTASP